MGNLKNRIMCLYTKYSTELSKEMWDYTNYENQVKHLKEAGLKPALLYGKGFRFYFGN